MYGCENLTLPLSETQQALFVFDSMSELPNIESLLRIMKNYHVHIIVLSKSYESPENLIKAVDCKLVRGCKCHTIDPLTNIHSTQRLVHTLMTNIYFAPTTVDQRLFEQLAEFTSGSPPIVEITSQLLLASYSKNHSEAAQEISEKFSLKTQHSDPQVPHNLLVRELSDNVGDKLPAVAELAEKQRDLWETKTVYDSWDSIIALVHNCGLTVLEVFLLNCLAAFGCYPVPFSIVTDISHIIAKSNHCDHLASSLHQKLVKFKFVKPCPSPAVLYSCETELVYVPQCLADCLWNNMEKVDKIAVLIVLHSCAESLLNQCSSRMLVHTLFPALFTKVFERNYTLIGREPYKQMYTILH